MYQKVAISSFITTKLKDDNFQTKYDIEASIDEVESEEDHVKLKFRFVLLSNPTNVKISIDGFTSVYGNPQEIATQLSNDERNIPRVVNTLYQEIFPFLYITSKTMQIPCPAYKLADIAKVGNQSRTDMLEQVEERVFETEPTEETTSVNNLKDMKTHSAREKDVPETLIEEQKIPTI